MNNFSHAVIRKLAAAETLGSVTIICIDKTGTITEDKLMIEQLFVAGQEFRVDGSGRGLSGHFYQNDKKVDITKQPAAKLLLELSSLSTMSTIDQADLKRDEAKAVGDPTEVALAVVAAKAGFYAFKEEREYPELLETPYDQRYRYSASVHKFGRTNRMIVKGAPEELLKRCRFQVSQTAEKRPLLQESRAKLEETANHYASQGYRVIALAYGDEPKGHKLEDHQAHDLVFVGFLGMIDPIRPEVRSAIGQAQAAGLKVMMLTGDHLLTAQTIAEKVGIGKGHTIHANELTHHTLEGVSVIARLSPQEKLVIVERLQKSGQIVAMTGDGVNDAPALKRADIGIAMGRGGTDVAIEAADMVLLKNDFSAIVEAIKQGRLIWENLRKIIYYLVSTSVAEALVVIGSLLFGWPLPLVAVQILWMNLVTDGVTSIAHAFEAPETNLMAPKNRPKTGLIDWPMLRRIILATITMAVGTLLLFGQLFKADLAYAQTVALTVMVFFQIFNLFASRSELTSVFRIPLARNRPLVGLFFVSLLLQLLAVYSPLGNRLFHTVPLSVTTLLICAAIALSILVVDELRKLTIRLLQDWAKAQQAFE